MKHYSLLKIIAILIVGSIFFDSCSTSYEARRFSHLDYVKKDKVSPANDASALNKENVTPLSKHESTGIETPGNDYSASLQPETNLPKEKPNKEIAPSVISPGTDSNEPLISHLDKKDIKKTIQIIKNGIKSDSKSSDSKLVDEPNKLLILWIALAGAAIVFSIIGAYVPFVWVFATLAWIASVVFFVLWLVAIANS